VTARSIALFIAAAIAEIGGAYLVWIGLREHKGALFVALGAITLALYGVIATFQPSHEFVRGTKHSYIHTNVRASVALNEYRSRHM
jgi:small multidrug resistance family-3 protein